MKLKNKRTGEIGYLQNDATVQQIRVLNDNNGTIFYYKSLTELNEEWEDYEEPKEEFEIIAPTSEYDISVLIVYSTHEEAEKAVEKLKAWKRLKNAGFEVENYGDDDIKYKIAHRYNGCVYDLETLFFGGGE